MRGTVGTTGLRRHYGGNQRHGTNTEHNRLAAAKNIRYCLKQLQDAQLVGTQKYVYSDKDILMGKCLTKKGQTDMDRIAAQMGPKGSKK